MNDPVIVLAMLAWLTSGLASVVTAPQNRAAQSLLMVGVGFLASVLLGPLLAQAPPTPSGALLIQLSNAGFLAADLGVTALLVIHPRGVLDRRWYGRALAVVTVVAALALLTLTVVAPRISVDGSGPGGRTHANPLAIPLLAGLEPVVDVFWTSTLVWPLVGVVVLVDRLRRADRAGRRELAPLAGGIALLAVLLVAQLAAILFHIAVPDPGFPLVFQLAITAVPVVLLAGIARRTRALDADLAASRTRLITAEDRARREIERDLHDGVQQQLVAILSLVQLAKRQQRRDVPSAAGTLDEIAGHVSDAIVDLRELVSGIRPPVLQDAGVAAALASRLQRLPADVLLDASAAPARWDDAVEAAAYFVGCEAVTNALKHAPGSRVTVRVVDTPTELAVEVRDAGPGIAEGWARGRGLSGLRDRVVSLGGDFAVAADPRGGTTVTARFTAVP
ncbi:sensor histidine kinase [uncultured Amnibacterium sp.]|uniref:sensor histidine kinase n=1 Tax=uncultured Amnibacterium sp. TaxID=1631851 RepID=UPI0035C979BC